MSVQPYPDDQIKRFSELTELFLRCRAAWRDVTIETEGHPSPGSLAARDQQEVAEHLAQGHPHTPLVIPSAVQRYMLAASEQFGGLAALYQAQEVLYSPANLARSLIEHCASAAWVLGTDGEPVANRLARAYREELKSMEEAKKNAGRLLGKEHPEHLRMVDGFKRCNDEIAEIFPGGWSVDEDGRRLLHGQRLPGLEGPRARPHRQRLRGCGERRGEKEPSQAIGIICCPERPVPGAFVLEIFGLLIMSDTIDRLDGPNVRFARSATRHRISKDHVRYVIANYRVRFEEPPPETDSARARSTRAVYLGDDDRGRALEIMAVEGKRGELLVIHAMELRDKYRKRYEDQR